MPGNLICKQPSDGFIYGTRSPHKMNSHTHSADRIECRFGGEILSELPAPLCRQLTRYPRSRRFRGRTTMTLPLVGIAHLQEHHPRECFIVGGMGANRRELKYALRLVLSPAFSSSSYFTIASDEDCSHAREIGTRRRRP